MRISSLYFTILVFLACESDVDRFNIKSREFQKKSSHHYSNLFEADYEPQSDAENSENNMRSTDKIQGDIYEDENEIGNKENGSSFFNILTNLFSFSNQEYDSIMQEFNECKERLYTGEDEIISQRLALNSLINERNRLLKQLDSLQTDLTISRRYSNNKIRKIEAEYRKMKSLVNILSREIE